MHYCAVKVREKPTTPDDWETSNAYLCCCVSLVPPHTPMTLPQNDTAFKLTRIPNCAAVQLCTRVGANHESYGKCTLSPSV